MSLRGLSRVLRKAHARFLGGWARATASGYPTPPGMAFRPGHGERAEVGALRKSHCGTLIPLYSVWVSELLVLDRRALRADPVAEYRIGMFGQVFFQWIPFVALGLYFFAKHAD